MTTVNQFEFVTGGRLGSACLHSILRFPRAWVPRGELVFHFGLSSQCLEISPVCRSHVENLVSIFGWALKKKGENAEGTVLSADSPVAFCLFTEGKERKSMVEKQEVQWKCWKAWRSV